VFDPVCINLGGLAHSSPMFVRVQATAQKQKGKIKDTIPN